MGPEAPVRNPEVAGDALREKVAEWMLKINQRLLSLGVLLFALFVTLNLA